MTLPLRLKKEWPVERSSDSRKEPKRALNAYEQQYDIVLPKDYRDFIVNPDVYNTDEGFYSNDLEYEPIEKPPVLGSDKMPMDSFTEPSGLADLMEMYDYRFHEALVPIVRCSFGDLLCLGVSGEFTGRVYYWDHENELAAKLMIGGETETDDINEYWDNLYLIANTFTDFVNGLTIVPDVQARVVRPVKVWASNAFLERVRATKERGEK